MKNFFKSIFNFFSILISRHKINAVEKETESFRKMIDPFKKASKKKFQRMGRLIWDCTKRGTFKRTWKKISRNEVCPCGRMREEPRDVSKRMKYKFCCGR